MTLLLFVLGILLALGIARYNKSYKLFLQLVISFAILGYATTVLCSRATSERNSKGIVQVSPTQAPVFTPSSILYLLADSNDLEPVKVTDSKPVSQGITPNEYNSITVSNEVFGRTRDQPIGKPPQLLKMYFDTS